MPVDDFYAQAAKLHVKRLKTIRKSSPDENEQLAEFDEAYEIAQSALDRIKEGEDE